MASTQVASPSQATLANFASSQIPALDGFRALCIIPVLGEHAQLMHYSGPHGVMAFFILSGFLISLKLLREYDSSGTISLRTFYRRRVFRIFPAFYVFVAAEFLIDLGLHSHRPWTDYASVLTFTGNFASVLYYPGPVTLAHTWSLAVEEHFYLILPAVFLLLIGNPAKLARFLAMVIVVVCAIRTSLLVLHLITPWAAYVLTYFRLDHLAIGCLLGVAIVNFPTRVQLVWSRRWIPWITALAVLVEMEICLRKGILYERSLGFIVDPWLIGAFMLQGVAYSWRWLCCPPLRYLGKISYSVYLFHWIGLKIAEAYFAHLSRYERAAFIVAVGLLLGTLAHHCIELPFLRMGRSRKAASSAHTPEARIENATAAIRLQ